MGPVFPPLPCSYITERWINAKPSSLHKMLFIFSTRDTSSSSLLDLGYSLPVLLVSDFYFRLGLCSLNNLTLARHNSHQAISTTTPSIISWKRSNLSASISNLLLFKSTTSFPKYRNLSHNHFCKTNQKAEPLCSTRDTTAKRVLYNNSWVLGSVNYTFPFSFSQKNPFILCFDPINSPFTYRQKSLQNLPNVYI